VDLEDTEFDPTNRPEVGSIVSVCAGLVAVDEDSNVIRLVHYTAQEYFSQEGQDRLSDAETRITKTCSPT
jgi:shikimate kinase